MKRNKSIIFHIILILLVTILSSLSSVKAEEEFHLRATIESPDPQSDAYFGNGMGIYGDLIVIGESSAKVEGEYRAGRIHIFDLDGNHKMTLHAPTPQAPFQFGWIMKVHNNIFVVKERATIDSKRLAGRLYFFDFNGTLLFTLESPHPQYYAHYGDYVEFCGDTIFVSEDNSDFDGYTNAGRIHLYDWEGNYLKSIYSPEPSTEAQYGQELDACDNLLVVSDFLANVEGIIEAGEVHIYDSEGVLLSTLQSPNPQQAMFGYQVSICGDIIAVCNNFEINDEVYLFNTDGDFLKTLLIPELDGDPGFISRVINRGNFILVSLDEAEVEGKEEAGIAYLFDRNGNYLKTIQSPAPEEESIWGVATRDITTSEDCSKVDFFVISESGADGNSEDEGRVHIFDSDGDILQTLYSPEPMKRNEFGYYVKLMDDILVVSEFGESKTGIVHIFQQGVEPTPEPTPTPTPEPTPTPTPEPKGGIPGFPVESVVIGVTLVILLLWYRK
jgi:hypothetical protein